MKLSKLREEVKLTLNLMQTDIDDDAHSELQMHLREILLLKREVLQQDDEEVPLTSDELKAGGWWCEDVSEECRLALVDKGVYVVSPCWSVDNRAKYAYKSGCGLSVIRTSLRVDELKQIHRVGNDFYWEEL